MARPSGGKLLLVAIAVAVAAIVGVAVAVLDSPAEERRQRLDERRIADLRAIAAAVDRHWTREKALPSDLDALVGGRGGDPPLTDPESEERYRFRTTGDKTYELCATFSTASRTRDRHRRYDLEDSFWHHPAGDHCFALEAETLD